ncbi:hypothetical protein COY23_03960 [bacterium (Candidatus Torokbacteria) CG_4_10_14_0_2_um_filter_35_8]|nr:MAG: hypothetical protein COY23_03960 [bacterium (Candidatus Torokbacteria) CG_4_10_14_0_2_um_filter_35_8]
MPAKSKNLKNKSEDFIKKLQSLPEAQRKRVLYFAISGIMVTIIAIWFWTLPGNLGKIGGKKEAEGKGFFGELKEIKEGFVSKLSESRDSSTDFKEMLDDQGSNKKEEDRGEPYVSWKEEEKKISSVIAQSEIESNLSLSQSKAQESVTVKIDRVEVSANKTYVYLYITNESHERLTLRKKDNVILMQEGKSLPEIIFDEKTAPKEYIVPDQISPEKKQAGVMGFRGKVDLLKPFRLEFRGIHYGCVECSRQNFVLEIS